MDEGFAKFVKRATQNKGQYKHAADLFDPRNTKTIKRIESNPNLRASYISLLSGLQKSYLDFNFESDAYLKEPDLRNLSNGIVTRPNSHYKLQPHTLIFKTDLPERLITVPKQLVKINKLQIQNSINTIDNDTGETFYSDKKLGGSTNHTIYTQWFVGHLDGKPYLFKKLITVPEIQKLPGNSDRLNMGMYTHLYLVPGGREEFATLLMRYDSYNDGPHPNKHTPEERFVKTPHIHALDVDNAWRFLGDRGGAMDAISISRLATLIHDNNIAAQNHKPARKDHAHRIAEMFAGRGIDRKNMDQYLANVAEMVERRNGGLVDDSTIDPVNLAEFYAINNAIDKVASIPQSSQMTAFYEAIVNKHFINKTETKTKLTLIPSIQQTEGKLKTLSGVAANASKRLTIDTECCTIESSPVDEGIIILHPKNEKGSACDQPALSETVMQL